MKIVKGILCTTALIFLFAFPVQAAELKLNIPSAQESTIAPGRSFYVLGSINEYTYSEGDTMKVTVAPKSDPTDIVREVSTDVYENVSMYINQEEGQNDLPAYFEGTTPEDIKKSGIPDLIYDLNDMNSFTNGSIKCYFDGEKFTALIYGGAVPDGMDDILDFHNKAGAPYAVLQDGEYVITVSLEDKDANEIASIEKDITIGVSADKILARFSPSTHFAAVQEFASKPEHNYRIYMDPFPGYWNKDRFNGADKFCEIKPEWTANDALEYTMGKVHFIIYNVSAGSTTYSVELGQLQYMEDIEKPDRLVNYYYSTGEPEPVANKESRITAFEEGDKLQLVRAETSPSPDADGVLNQDQPAAEAYDFDFTDGVIAKAGETISLYGVTAPIQIEKDDIISTGKNSYELKNKIAKVTYHLTGEGIDKTISQPVTLNRIRGGWNNYSEMEFKHNILLSPDLEGKEIQVEVQGYDAHDALVEGTAENFVISVLKGEADNSQNPGGSGEQNQTTTNIKTPGSHTNKEVPATGDSTVISIYGMLVLLALFYAAAKYRRTSKMR